MISQPSRAIVPGVLFLLASALILAIWVVPLVRVDSSPDAAPGRAVPALWANLLVTALMAGIALASFSGHMNPTRLRRVVAAIAGAVAIVLGLILIDAAVAFAGHGPGMHGAVVGLWVSVGCSLIGGVTILRAALVRRT